MKVYHLVYVFLILFFSLHATEIRLTNDSPYVLTALIKAADGKVIGKQTLIAQQEYTWRDSLVSNTSNVSVTPYTVVWLCPHEDQYTICIDVSPGAAISANNCTGIKYCPPKKKEKKCPACNCPACPIQQPAVVKPKELKQKDVR